jgi:F0F1-type ATP synthase delta subunit
MKIENNPTTNQVPDVVRRVLVALDEATQFTPIDVMLTELHLIIERLTFHDITSEPDKPLRSEDIHVLLSGDISDSLTDFIQWAAQQNLLKLFKGQGGEVFLGYCARYYRQVPQVTVTSPIQLEAAFKRSIIDQLRTVHPLPTRLIFKTEPSLVVGCVITTPKRGYDYSLKRGMLNSISTHLLNQTLGEEVPRG